LAPVIVQTLRARYGCCANAGFTIVMVEQNFRFAAPLADRFYVMEHGRIVEASPRPNCRASVRCCMSFWASEKVAATLNLRQRRPHQRPIAIDTRNNGRESDEREFEGIARSGLGASLFAISAAH